MYFVYILQCHDNSFYTGFTNSLKLRLQNHRNGFGSKYIKSKLPIVLIYFEAYEDRTLALKREKQLKGWSRVKKIKILKLEKVVNSKIDITYSF